jgi:hypothetical protein
LPATVPTSPQVEASALPRETQTPLLPVAQETPLEPEQVLPPAQGIRHEANACVGDSPRGPLKRRGNPHLKPATKPKHAEPDHAGA